ncbi:hypothetical protein KP509_36G052700 [Ceratopteris richardii]|uniref:Treslin n=1 Tax=Ceratopteris richardii TaxID=49495 RepID=A0A8T2QD35_CERRI|nr:hypothetical protein KP509_36G052700 [Ceratopteris richardii]
MTAKEIERLVIMVDIRAWILHPNPNKLASILQNCVRTVLASMSPTCRWGFKLFDSSMNPFASSCRISKLLGSWACTTRFDSVRPGGDNSPTLPEVFAQFSSVLNCLHTEIQKAYSTDVIATKSFPIPPANAVFTASALMELFSDCIWSPLLSEREETATRSSPSSLCLPVNLNSNLVILFSTLPFNHLDLTLFLGVKTADSEAELQDVFRSTFRKVYGSYAASDIHLCWVDVPVSISMLEPEKELICSDRVHQRSSLTAMLVNLGWSFTSLDVLSAGLCTMPFSVLWKGLAHPLLQLRPKYPSKFIRMCIQVKDVDKKILSASLCKVETIPIGSKQIERFIRNRVLHVSGSVPKQIFDCASKHLLAQSLVWSKGAEKAKLDVLEVKLGDGIDSNFVGDYLLGHIHQHQCSKFEPGKPAWQLLMLHLAREGRLAVFDIDSDDCSCFGLIEPISVHIALLSIVTKAFLLESHFSLTQENSVHSSQRALVFNTTFEKSSNNITGSQPTSVETSSQSSQAFVVSCKLEDMICKASSPRKRKPFDSITAINGSNPKDNNLMMNDHRNKRAKQSHALKCENAQQHVIKKKLEDYYTKSSRRSKTIKLLSCWMRQTKEENYSDCAPNLNPLAALLGFHISHQDAGPGNPLVTVESDSKSLENNTQVPSIQDSIAFPMTNHSHRSVCAKNADQFTIDSLQSKCSNQDEANFSMLAIPLDCFNNEKGNLTVDDNELTEANAYMASVKQKIDECLLSSDIDLYSFSQRMMMDVRNAISIICAKSSTASEISTGSFKSIHNERILGMIKESLLQNPKVLSLKYKNCRPPKSASIGTILNTNSDMLIYGSEEKVKEYELQILFRMEILSILLKSSHQQTSAQALIDDICMLLESIQFNLPGGVLEGESLLDFSNNAIKQRYYERLPSVVEKIYTAMEFNGHNEVSEDDDLDPLKAASESIPSISAHDSPRTEEDQYSNSDNAYSSSHIKFRRQCSDLTLQRSLFSSGTKFCSAESSEQRLKQAEARRERAKRFSHFASSCRSMLQVTVTPKINLAACPKKTQQKHHGGSKSKHSKLNRSSECEVILQTPFSMAKQRSERPSLAAKKKLLVWNW